MPIYKLDAFTHRVFGGNPAAVVVLERWLPDSVLQAIAAENNVSETAFVIPEGGAFPLRWFTPAVEVDLCGHATLATAHVLFGDRAKDRSRLRFHTQSGELVVDRDGVDLAMEMPARHGREVEPDDVLIRALGAKPSAAYLARDLMAVLDSEESVRRFVPDSERIAAIDAFALLITAPGSDCDFVSRFFAPNAGVLEDPATGSSHCTLIPYWAARLGKKDLRARQLSPRGAEMKCRLGEDAVTISGGVVEYLRGEIVLD